MSIDFSGNVSVACCEFKFGGYRVARDESIDLRAVWNSKWFKNLRERFSQSDLSNTGCEGCRFLRMPPSSVSVPAGLTPEQEQNSKRSLELWHQGALELDSSPCLFQVDFGRECNLNCIMCPQTEVRSSFGQQYKYRRLLESLRSQYDVMAKAEKVLVFGGEPLFIPESRTFIRDFLANPRIDDVELHLVTNGVLLHEFFEDFTQQRRLLVSLSIDAVGAGYERIRKGAKWSKVLKNIQDFSSLRTTTQADWTLRLNTLLMRSSVKDLGELLRMAIALGVDQMSFTGLIPNRRTQQEDILGLARDSDECKQCKMLLNDAVAYLQDQGKETWCKGLLDLLKQLEQQPQQTGAVQQSVLLDDNLAATLHEKKVMIWGTGSYYRIWLSDWLKNNLRNFTFLGFVDNDAMQWSRELDGYPIHSPQQLQEMLDVDYILVANPHVDAIRHQATLLGLGATVI